MQNPLSSAPSRTNSLQPDSFRVVESCRLALTSAQIVHFAGQPVKSSLSVENQLDRRALIRESRPLLTASFYITVLPIALNDPAAPNHFAKCKQKPRHIVTEHGNSAASFSKTPRQVRHRTRLILCAPLLFYFFPRLYFPSTLFSLLHS